MKLEEGRKRKPEGGEKNERRARRRGNFKMAKIKEIRGERSSNTERVKGKGAESTRYHIRNDSFPQSPTPKETRRGRAEWLRGDETSFTSYASHGPPCSPKTSTLVGHFAGSSVRANTAGLLNFISWYLHWRGISNSYFT